MSIAITQRDNRTLSIHIWSKADMLAPTRAVAIQTAGRHLPVAGSGPFQLRADIGAGIDNGGGEEAAADGEVLGNGHV